MASSSTSSSLPKSFKYDVFLSFRGEDTRNNFVGHLYHALHQKGIETYKDDEKIVKGKTINDQLIISIENSRFYIIVFSKNYASSSWCLNELVKIMECQKTTDQTAYPVFYDVEPTEVRKQSGAVGEALAKHDDVVEAAQKWREALKEAANLAGWELKNSTNGDEAKFIQKIVEKISLDLRSINFSTDEKLVGMGTRVKGVVSSLETSADDVRVIGIKGIGGGGKTTLARAVFDQISVQFEGKSFVENVREISKGSLYGLKSLQKQVLSDVLNDPDIIVSNVYDGKNMMKRMLCRRKVLLVLDDVDQIDQLEALVGHPNWYKSGSRIIITTRDEQVLITHGVNLIRDVNLLSLEEAICLFSRYAFGREVPIQGYEELSREVVHYASGLPLTIRVLGSFLCGKNELEWIDSLKRLKKIPLKETLEKLELSYIGLEEDYKEIFLDIACILKGWKKEKAVKALESCGFHARNGLRVLEQKSLITFSKLEYLDMHDHIEEMGKNIVRRLHPDDPNKHSRLWIDEEIEDVLANNLGTKATKCIKLRTVDQNWEIVMRGLREMKKLRYLYVSSSEDVHSSHRKWNFDEASQYFPNALRYMDWFGYPLQSLPKTFQVNNLISLRMPNSRIVQLWEGGETKLRILYLSGSKLSTLDMGLTPDLEWLDLRECSSLVELVPSGCLKKLVFLDLSGCWRFKSFLLHNLKQPKIVSLPELDLIAESVDVCPLHRDNNLPKFRFRCVYSEILPSETGNLKKLISIGLCACTNLGVFSDIICSLRFLRKLKLEGCIPEVPQDLDQLACLEEKAQQSQPSVIYRLEVSLQGTWQEHIHQSTDDQVCQGQKALDLRTFLNLRTILSSDAIMNSLLNLQAERFIVVSSYGSSSRLVSTSRSQELLKGYKRKNGPQRCGLKIDLQKAYDTVSWSFLEEVLKQYGFHNQMIRWIMTCVSSSAFSIWVNGQAHGYFKGAREDGNFKYNAGCKELKITHLCFVDDLMAFCHGDTHSISIVKESLNEFSRYSGLLLNLEKSTVFFGSIKENLKRVNDCKVLIEKVKTRIGDWKNRGNKSGRANVAWKIVCRPKDQGGLGIKPLKDGRWKWPNEWFVKFPLLKSIEVPSINDRYDQTVWLNNKGKITEFAIKDVWLDLRCQYSKVDCLSSVLCVILLVTPSTTYFLIVVTPRREMNIRFFQDKKRSEDVIIREIIEDIKWKSSFIVKRTQAVSKIYKNWDIKPTYKK
uniref:TMV resistance protein N-like n=1 Tax=Tanacetum cinerariifolium TaxID=118510 RepID=A0A6L2LU02_TANCI|nr:TMV resistance protein N-like [Tanacetum cinerariifolium]